MAVFSLEVITKILPLEVVRVNVSLKRRADSDYMSERFNLEWNEYIPVTVEYSDSQFNFEWQYSLDDSKRKIHFTTSSENTCIEILEMSLTRILHIRRCKIYPPFRFKLSRSTSRMITLISLSFLLIVHHQSFQHFSLVWTIIAP